jgi:hypothetical protein
VNRTKLVFWSSKLLEGGCSTGASGVGDAELFISFCCLIADVCTGTTTWKVGCGFTATWFWVDSVGLFIDFIPKSGTGSASYWFGGQCCPTDWTAGHLQVRDYSIDAFSGTDCQVSSGPYPYAGISWDHEFDRSGGAVNPLTSGTYDGWTSVQMNIEPDGATGFHRTNCGLQDEPRNAAYARWIIDTNAMLQGRPSTWVDCAPNVPCTA